MSGLKHPAHDCNANGVRVFEMIATGHRIGHHPDTLAALHRRGLIEFEKQTIGTNWPRVTIKVPYVPIPVHMRWCEWCSQQPEIDVEADEAHDGAPAKAADR